MRSLVVADCRCGGTNLVKSLGSHPGMHMRDINLCQEKLADHWAEGREPEWESWLEEQWSEASVWHLQRYQISRRSSGWDFVLKANPKVISLFRENTLLQYLSWKYACHTQQFHRRQKLDISLPFDNSDYIYWASAWRDKKTWVRNKLRPLNCIEVSYEDLQYNWDATLARIQSFLGLAYCHIPEYMPEPTPLDYYSIFGLKKK